MRFGTSWMIRKMRLRICSSSFSNYFYYSHLAVWFANSVVFLTCRFLIDAHITGWWSQHVWAWMHEHTMVKPNGGNIPPLSFTYYGFALALMMICRLWLRHALPRQGLRFIQNIVQMTSVWYIPMNTHMHIDLQFTNDWTKICMYRFITQNPKIWQNPRLSKTMIILYHCHPWQVSACRMVRAQARAVVAELRKVAAAADGSWAGGRLFWKVLDVTPMESFDPGDGVATFRWYIPAWSHFYFQNGS